MEFVIMSVLIWNSLCDQKYKKISVSATLLGIVVIVFLLISKQGTSWTDSMAGAAVGLFLILCSVLTRGQIGIGDGIVFFMTGMGCGFFENITLLFISLSCSAIISAFLLILKKAGRKTKIPFVPFVAVSYFCIQMLKTNIIRG